MDGRPQDFEGGSKGAVGAAKQLSQCRAKGTALSRTPAERRLGDRALPSQRFGALALLDAQTRGRASDTILHGFARLRSAARRLSRARRRKAGVQEWRDPV